MKRSQNANPFSHVRTFAIFKPSIAEVAAAYNDAAFVHRSRTMLQIGAKNKNVFSLQKQISISNFNSGTGLREGGGFPSTLRKRHPGCIDVTLHSASKVFTRPTRNQTG